MGIHMRALSEPTQLFLYIVLMGMVNFSLCGVSLGASFVGCAYWRGVFGTNSGMGYVMRREFKSS